MAERTLTPEQRQRYARHLALAEVGPAGQQKLLRARVLIVGVGALGSPVALYLAASGVGTIGLADHDHVRLSNLQRQIIHTMEGLNRSKVDGAARTVSALNPDIKVETVEANLLRSAGQLVPPVGPARRGDEAGPAEDHQHLVQKGARDRLAAGDLATLQRTPASMSRQLEDSPDAVFGFHRKTHAHSP